LAMFFFFKSEELVRSEAVADKSLRDFLD